MNLGEFIKKQIQDRGLKLKFVAEKCGMSEAAIYACVNGRRNFSKPVLRLLSIQFGIDTVLPEGGDTNAKAS